jgi:hypothetical protein
MFAKTTDFYFAVNVARHWTFKIEYFLYIQSRVIDSVKWAGAQILLSLGAPHHTSRFECM